MAVSLWKYGNKGRIKVNTMELHKNALLRMPLSTEAPEYIEVLPLGYISSDKGNFLVDTESYNLIKEHMERRAVDIVIDYEHQTLKDIPAPAGGWVKALILKDNGIYAKVEWTERARNYIKNKEYKYLSPVVLVRDSDRKVLRIHSIALTNTPAIKGTKPIVNSLKPSADHFNELNETEKQICKMLNLDEFDFITYGIYKGEGKYERQRASEIY